MRRWMRRIGLGMAAGAASIVVFLATALAPVDRREARELPCYGEGLSSVTRAVGAVSSKAAAPLLRVGAARANFTPTTGAAVDHPARGEFVALPLAGYGNRQGRPAQGVADPLWAKAVAFASAAQTGVVVAADALIIPRDVAEDAARRVRERCGLPREALYFGATHTHCGPGGWGEGRVAEAFAGGFRPGVRVWMAQQLAEAACAALSDLQPAELATASFSATNWVRNRLVGERGRIDPRFSLISVTRTGAPPVVVGAYAAHATVLSGSEMQFSGDYPGVWQRDVERLTGGTAIFLAGAVGSHAPRAPGGGREGAQAMGQALAARTIDAIGQARPVAMAALALVSADIPLPPLQPRLSEDWKIRPWLARRLLPVGERTWVQALRVGDAVWVSTPCDFSGELALDLAARGRDRGVETVVTSFNGDYVGYVVPAAYYSLNTYETRTMAFFGPQLPGYLSAVMEALVEGVTPGALAEASQQP